MTTILQGDCIEQMRTLAPDSVQTCITSPPYFGLRDYGHDGQIGREETPDEYVARLVEVFREVHRVLRKDGTLWLNLGDSYAANGGSHGGRQDNQRGVGAKRTHDAGGADSGRRRAPVGLKAKDLIGIPWRVAFALQADGWFLRQDIIWHKPNPMPESVRDRCTKAHEYLFLLSKEPRYYFDAASMQENGSTSGRRNRRSVWTIQTRPFKGAHFATFPPALVRPCILAGSRPGDIVLDPFGGSGTTAAVAIEHRRRAILIEINQDYRPLIEQGLPP
jgi:site-specific DNA-methyltransferase (adenine-specific)